MSRSRTHLGVLALVTLTMACSGGTDSDDQATRVVRSPLLRTSNYEEQAPEAYRVTLTTSVGDVVIQIYRDWGPIGADRFYNLAKGGFYDDTRIYRVLPGFMAQWGLNGDPYVNQAWKTEYLVDDPVVESNTRGRVSFAKGARHTRTTEIFINYKDNASLDDSGFTPIGEVVEGMDVADTFYAEYGDGPPRGEGPYQAMAAARGNPYFDEEFPELTRILSGRHDLQGAPCGHDAREQSDQGQHTDPDAQRQHHWRVCGQAAQAPLHLEEHSPGDRQTQDEAHTELHDRTSGDRQHNAFRSGTQGRSYSDLSRAFTHGERHERVDARDREREQHSDERPRPAPPPGHLKSAEREDFVERERVGDDRSGIHLAGEGSQPRYERLRVATREDCDPDGMKLSRSQRMVQPRLAPQRSRAHAEEAHHTNDLIPRSVLTVIGRSVSHASADRVPASKYTIHETGVDDDGRAWVTEVVQLKSAPCQDRLLQRSEIVHIDTGGPDSPHAVRRLSRVTTIHFDKPTGVVGARERTRYSDSTNARFILQPLNE